MSVVTLTEAWSNFAKHVRPHFRDPILLETCRRAFYSGVLSLATVQQSIAELNDEDAAMATADVNDEMDAVISEITASVGK